MPRPVVPILRSSRAVVLGAIHGQVVGHHQVGGGADAQPAGVDLARAELVQLAHERARVDDDARSDDAQRPRVEDAGWHQVDSEASLIADDRMAGIGPAVAADHQVRIAREQVDDLALALVAPLTADNRRDWHERILGDRW